MTSLHADEALLTYYQFSHDPFAPRTPGFKFFPAQRKQVLGQLHHLARYSRLLLVVSGPLGSGKTLLRQALVASSNKQSVLCVVVSARASARVDGLLRQIALGLGLGHADEQSILGQVEQLAATGQELYLLVDDAELLETAALDALLALAAGTAMGRPHVFLFGEPELVARLQSLADGEERFHVLRLNPYALNDTREYLALRLEGAGSDIGVFSDEQIEAIHHESGGWPGEVNRLARELLHEEMQSGYAEDDDSPGLILPKKHLLALAVVAVAVAAAWFVRGGAEDEAPVVAQQSLAEAPSAPAAEPADVVPSQSVADEIQPVLREPLAQAASEADVADVGIAGPAAVVAATTTAALAPSTQAPVAPSAPAPKPALRAPAVVQSAPAPQPKPAVQSPAAVAKPVSPPAQPAPAPRVVAKPVAPVPAPAASAAPVAAKPAPATPPSQVAPKPAPQPAAAVQAASRYTLQVLGTRSESSARAFVRAQGAGYRYFRKLHQGQPLFVVTYGSFASRAEAQAAIKTLPAAVQSSKPWPRTFASIQQEAGVR
ncbi:AAA family ATPase [Azotobacter chroococcum]|uniref:DamX protein n=1 Tax=Azotobacter chroococcum TaxID=353 RepID=A0A4R1PNK5_9GAMM|nr:AAA family ATPase [Azotobacter chroococcum]TBW00228.1 cell division protein [Azotobacter chroococcum]TCL31896.1 DamX protein [Azotobacter chroococcum]